MGTAFFHNFAHGGKFPAKSMELSVIIPIYNSRDTLARCLESVLRQQTDGMEVLLIDDGSTDGSGLMADRWAARYPMVSVCHKHNGGLSDARNAGLHMARGRYVTFVDADDEVADGTYPMLLDLLAGNVDTDILEFPVRVHAGHSTQHDLTLPDRRWPSSRSYWLETEAWEHTYACNKVYRRALFSQVQFPMGRVFEDMWTIPHLLALPARVQTTGRGMYIYHWNHSGITATASGEALAQLLEAQMRAVRLTHTHMLPPHGWRLYHSMLCRQLDVYRLTGRTLLGWPLVKLLCRLHQSCH